MNRNTPVSKMMALFATAALVAALFALAGCGGQQPAASSSAASSASSATESSSSAASSSDADSADSSSAAAASSSAASASTTAATDDDPDLVGMWTLTTMNIGGQDYTVAEYEEANDLPEGTLDSYYVLNDDGTLVTSVLDTDVEGVWVQDGTDLVLTVTGEGGSADTIAEYQVDPELGEVIVASDPNTGNTSTYVRE